MCESELFLSIHSGMGLLSSELVSSVSMTREWGEREREREREREKEADQVWLIGWYDVPGLLFSTVTV